MEEEVEAAEEAGKVKGDPSQGGPGGALTGARKEGRGQPETAEVEWTNVWPLRTAPVSATVIGHTSRFRARLGAVAVGHRVEPPQHRNPRGPGATGFRCGRHLAPTGRAGPGRLRRPCRPAR
ncbi:hypothetical protein Saso_63220 [Streptomyces asoensis]|uniref:Uncharacterized protein n=1 Tax=Streptomyces asoensis TaxID=249586 RepID=A0ABQ3S9F0_9ACTN|nr:hypothetical protein GCM10010496_38930 [Streptomyces asoensis]GHI64672.1 hypothetical protein Saso_63220 [Streptomyces asoensis]